MGPEQEQEQAQSMGPDEEQEPEQEPEQDEKRRREEEKEGEKEKDAVVRATFNIPEGMAVDEECFELLRQAVVGTGKKDDKKGQLRVARG